MTRNSPVLNLVLLAVFALAIVSPMCSAQFLIRRQYSPMPMHMPYPYMHGGSGSGMPPHSPFYSPMTPYRFQPFDGAPQVSSSPSSRGHGHHFPGSSGGGLVAAGSHGHGQPSRGFGYQYHYQDIPHSYPHHGSPHQFGGYREESESSDDGVSYSPQSFGHPGHPGKIPMSSPHGHGPPSYAPHYAPMIRHHAPEEPHLHREHVHVHNIYKHNVHHHNVKKEHVHQPVYHKSEKHLHSNSESHKNNYKVKEYNKHNHPLTQETHKWLKPIYADESHSSGASVGYGKQSAGGLPGSTGSGMY